MLISHRCPRNNNSNTPLLYHPKRDIIYPASSRPDAVSRLAVGCFIWIVITPMYIIYYYDNNNDMSLNYLILNNQSFYHNK